ncbi:ATP synthase F0 subunit B [Gluconobacter oxydans]|uniref:F0F1 ATP synthase subunit B family protein n=1 Tax=Gluconobacter oxydans TaxID=442 RepID=UPI001CD85C7F|nr:ATP synthase F0 subunit B [Gluconobacter oxydans]
MTVDWWTIGLQVINVSVLIWLLSRFFWRPICAVISRRQQEIAARLAQVTDGQKQLEADRAAIKEARSGFEQERARIVQQAQQEAQSERQAILAKAQQDAAALEAGAKQSIAQEEAENQARWRSDAATLSCDIAGQLLAETGCCRPARETLFDRLLKAIATLPDRERLSLRDGFTFATATAPGPDERQAYENALMTAVGEHPAITWTVDPALVEGFAVKTPYLTVASNWQADLVRIREGLSHAGH